MYRLEIVKNLINLYEQEELIYSFNWESLNKIWSYATIEYVEGINAGYEDGLMTIILTTASGQGGIVAIVDTRADKLIHIHDGAFAIKVLITDDKVVTLYHVMCYGRKSTYFVDCTLLNNLKMVEGDANIELSEEVEFNDENIVLTLEDGKLSIEDSEHRVSVDISSLI